MSNRNNRRNERGEGRVKFLFSLAVIAAIVYFSMQVIPVYLHYQQMQDATQEIVRIAALQNLRDADIHARLVERATEYNLPDNVKIEVTRNGKKVSARVAYAQVITLPYYSYTWPFDFRKEESGF